MGPLAANNNLNPSAEDDPEHPLIGLVKSTDPCQDAQSGAANNNLNPSAEDDPEHPLIGLVKSTDPGQDAQSGAANRRGSADSEQSLFDMIDQPATDPGQKKVPGGLDSG